MPRVIHFQISTDKPEELAEFYEKVFGWKIRKLEGPVENWLIITGEESEPGIDGGIVRRTKQEHEQSVLLIVDVSSVDEFSKKVAENRGTIVDSKRALPGIGWLVLFKGPEGTMSGMLERDESLGMRKHTL